MPQLIGLKIPTRTPFASEAWDVHLKKIGQTKTKKENGEMTYNIQNEAGKTDCSEKREYKATASEYCVRSGREYH